MGDALQLQACPLPGEGYICGADVDDAFYQVPLRPDESRFVCTRAADRYCVCKVAIFGADSAPTTTHLLPVSTQPLPSGVAVVVAGTGS